MANTKQAEKMIRKIKRKTRYNRWWKLKVKSAIESLDSVIAEANVDKESVDKEYIKLQKTLDKASKNGVIHKKKINRIKSQAKKKTLTA